MKKEIMVGLSGLAAVIIIITALFSNKDLRDAGENALYEIRTFDAWKQSAFTSFAPLESKPLTGFANSGFSPYPGDNMVTAAFSWAPLITHGEVPPQLIKELGIEVISISAGKVKIVGVMGNSWAEEAGLKRGDIILRFNRKMINGLQHFKSLVKGVRPERDYRIRILRGGRIKSLRVTVGEGEMEGFSPIRPVTFMSPVGLGGQGISFYHYPRWGTSFMTANNRMYARPICPVCNLPMRRTR